MAYTTLRSGDHPDSLDEIIDAAASSHRKRPTRSSSRHGSSKSKVNSDHAKSSYKAAQSTIKADTAFASTADGSDVTFQPHAGQKPSREPVQQAKRHAHQQAAHRDLDAARNVKSRMKQAEAEQKAGNSPAGSPASAASSAQASVQTIRRETRTDPAIPQATPVTGHFNIVCLTAKGYNRLIDLLLKEANHYDKMGEAGKDVVAVMENMVYTFSKSSSRFTDLQGNTEVLLTIMDEDFTNILGILLKAAYTGHPDPKVDYSSSLPYAGT